MEPGPLLVALLNQAAPVVALVGGRVYPVLVPEGTPYPYLTYQLISQAPEAGSSLLCALDDEARVQLSFFAATYREVCLVSAACRVALDGQLAGRVGIAFDGHRDQPSDPNICFFRTSDYLLDGLAAS